MSAEPADRPADLAVVIVSHNTRELLLDCLRSLHDGGLLGITANIVVVDNGSSDGSPDAVARLFPDVGLDARPDNLGYATANNRGLRALGFVGPGHPAQVRRACRHALLLNPDTVVPPGALAGLIGALEAEDDLGAVGPKLLLPDGSLDLACRRSFPTPEVSFYRMIGLSRLLPGSRRFGRYNLTFLDPEQPADVDAVVGACMLVRGEAIDDVGLLDEAYWMYGEDLDWALRLRQSGWRVAYRPSVVVHHVKRASSRRSPRARYEFQRAMWLFYRKHYAATTRRSVHFAVMAALALRGGPRLLREMRAAGPAPAASGAVR